MTDIVPTPPAPDVPQYPALGSSNFNQEAYDYGSSMPAVSLRIWEIGKSSETNATASKEQAILAAQAVSDSSGSAADAAQSAADALESSNAAAQSATDAANSATDSANSASDALDSKNAAAQSASDSAQSATDAANSATAAEGFRDEAENFRNEAQTFATQQLVGTSTSSVTPGAGTKTLLMETGRAFVAGMYLVATSTTSPGTRMSGYVSSYDAATGQLVIAVDEYSGSAAASDWVIGVAAKGSDGMALQVITADTVAVPGVVYVIASANAVLTLPTTGLSEGDSIGVRLAAPVSYNQIVDFGSIPLRGQVAGERYLDKKGFGLDLKYNATLGEWV